MAKRDILKQNNKIQAVPEAKDISLDLESWLKKDIL